ncbi:MAG: 6-bladed beta-propeller [Bacteroidetes bacterium]|jgi:hypothetical protein|nr:6-bladed beta-propeller [Bacteroidota bacterium]MBT3748686.1 6-bladed beta-propeller [Bacteroidota bacterium]MBT4399587.1 6-bladed beta-propeller [Bacteroidota bacterium]MBT4409308.1 6-bladed beta-propeller [Bacteroidota bacterium]MBT7093683.1 6-bladed beta-propeller [Bacteroidota bacterium]
MKVFKIALLAALILCTTACQDPLLKSDDIINIDITEAWKTRKVLKLSDLVKEVEYIQVESNVDCYMNRAQMRFFGKKHILFYDSRINQYYLFNRDGSFKCKVGTNGKGPGEYGLECKATMSKDETKIIISDWSATKVILYNTEGRVLKQKDLSSEIKSRFVNKIYCDYKNRITFLPRRPFDSNDGFASLVYFDFELNRIGEVLPRNNDNQAPYVNLSRNASISNKNGTYFWEMYNDTVYQYNKEGDAIPRFHFLITENNLTEKAMQTRMTGKDMSFKYTFPSFVYWLPGHLCIHCSGKVGNVFYDLKSKEAFGASIENDIYGFRVSIASYGSYYPDQDICVSRYYWEDNGYYRERDKIRNMEVTNPELRDELFELADNPAEDQGPIIMILRMKQNQI